MSPGNQMRALTANKASPKRKTITIGKIVDRKKPKTKNLCEYENKVVLAVNVASRCGYTYQYDALQSLYEEYKEQMQLLDKLKWLDVHMDLDKGEATYTDEDGNEVGCHRLIEASNPQKLKTELQSKIQQIIADRLSFTCLLYTSPSPRDATLSRMPSSA